MTTQRKINIPLPMLAIGAIALGWIGLLTWPSRTHTGEPAEASETREKASPPIEQEATNLAAALPAPYAGPDDSATESWSTYHGGPSLTGNVDMTLPDSLTVLWRYQAPNAVYYTPVACEGRIYFATSKGAIIALDMQGNEVWTRHIVRKVKRGGKQRMERFDAPLACFNGTVLAGSMSGKLFALDAATGEDIWVYEVGGSILGTANLHAPSDGEGAARVFVIGQDDGTLHSIDLITGEAVWQTEGIDRCDGSPSVRGDLIIFGSCAAALHIFSATDGSLIKNIEFDGDSQVAGGVALVGDSVFSGSNSGRVFHADVRTGSVLWVNEDSEDEVFTTPAVNREWVVFSSYDGNTYGLDRRTGKRQWTYESNGLPASPVIAGDKVLVSTNGSLFLLSLKTGKELWAYEVSDEITSPAIINGMIVVGSEDGSIMAFGIAKG